MTAAQIEHAARVMHDRMGCVVPWPCDGCRDIAAEALRAAEAAT